jgi:1-acyl-sn-glycerol-3-phosphate acyltransferase
VIRWILNIHRLAYRAWFFIVTGFFTLLWSPLALIASSREAWYPLMYWIARNLWAIPILYAVGCPPEVKGARSFLPDTRYMLIANHTSYHDIMLMLYISRKPFVFVGKVELAEIPVFGLLYRRASILVNRSDRGSRGQVFRSVSRRLTTGVGICIFPEAGVPEHWYALGPFKKGAFTMAKDHGLTLVPMTFYDCKERLNWNYFSGGPGRVRAYIHPHITPEDARAMSWEELRDYCHQLIQQDYLSNKWSGARNA